MRCRHCGEKYGANDWAQWPGGFEAPGTWLGAAAFMAVVAAGLFWFDVRVWKWVALALAALFLAQVPGAIADCSDAKTCPKCGGANAVRAWSL